MSGGSFRYGWLARAPSSDFYDLQSLMASTRASLIEDGLVDVANFLVESVCAMVRDPSASLPDDFRDLLDKLDRYHAGDDFRETLDEAVAAWRKCQIRSASKIHEQT